MSQKMRETSGSAQDKVSPMTALNFEFVLYRTITVTVENG